MTGEELKQAWLDNKLVTYAAPNEKPIKNCAINAVIYRRHPHNNRIMVSCELQDPTAKNCIITARANYLTSQ